MSPLTSRHQSKCQNHSLPQIFGLAENKIQQNFCPGKYLDWIKIKVSKQNLANQQIIFIRYLCPWEKSN